MIDLESHYTSQFMQNVFEHRYFTLTPDGRSKYSLAQKFYQKAAEYNPAIAELTQHSRELQESWDIAMEFPHWYYPASEHKGAIEQLKLQMERGEIPLPDFETEKDTLKMIAGKQVELERTHMALDGAYKAFEDHFFVTPEGAKFQEYVRAAKNGDFSAYLHDHPPIEPAAKEAVRDVKAGVEDVQHAAKEEGVVEEALSTAKKWSRGSKIAAGVAAATAVAGGGWVLYEHHRRKETPAEQKTAIPTR